MIKYALLSVADKTGLLPLAQAFQTAGYKLLATGGTKSHLEKNGFETKELAKLTGFPEILGGRVKTLHPLVHGAILADRSNPEHRQAITEHNLPTIDFVVVNLYPFQETAIRTTDVGTITEQIDIGGPTLLRAAAKNHRFVLPVVNPADYPEVIDHLQKNDLTFEDRLNFAARVFNHTANYDAWIATWFRTLRSDKVIFPAKAALPLDLHALPRYGENPVQKAAVYETNLISSNLMRAQKLGGKELSFNNYADADAALAILREFAFPTVVALKHANPCGVGSADTLEEAWQKAWDGDPVSIFGGIVAFNGKLTTTIAKSLKNLFLEIVIASDFSPEALRLLKTKPNLRLLLMQTADDLPSQSALKSIAGGILVQTSCPPISDEDFRKWTLTTSAKATDSELADLLFALRVVKHVKSNAIVVAKNQQILGVGAGQMNRLSATKLALENLKVPGAVLASDAFFPQTDCLELVASHKISAVVQPGGSINDPRVIATANKQGMAMYFCHNRYFSH